MSSFSNTVNVRPNDAMLLTADAKSLPHNLITVDSPRKRAFDKNVCDELMESIERQGLLHPIGVKRLSSGGYKLIYGFHRLEAVKRLFADACKIENNNENIGRFTNIDCLVYSKDIPDVWCERKEIEENLKRADLSHTERMIHAKRLADLVLQIDPPSARHERRSGAHASSNSDERRSGAHAGDENGSKKRGRHTDADPWFSVWYKAASIPRTTAQDWWEKFRKVSSEYDLPASLAPVAVREAFKAWLEAAKKEDEQRKVAAEKAAKDKAKADEEAARKAKEQREREAREKAVKDLVNGILAFESKFGADLCCEAIGKYQESLAFDKAERLLFRFSLSLIQRGRNVDDVVKIIQVNAIKSKGVSK